MKKETLKISPMLDNKQLFNGWYGSMACLVCRPGTTRKKYKQRTTRRSAAVAR